jgi:hypothetical protein
MSERNLTAVYFKTFCDYVLRRADDRGDPESYFTISIDNGMVDVLRAMRGMADQIPHWISVKDRLPDVKDGVLWYAVKDDGYGEIRISSWSGDVNHGIPHVWGFGDSFTPSYWMPLPEPPAE